MLQTLYNWLVIYFKSFIVFKAFPLQRLVRENTDSTPLRINASLSSVFCYVMQSFVSNDWPDQARIFGRKYCWQNKAKKYTKKILKDWTSLKINLLVWAKLSNNSILTDKGKNLFPKNLPGHRIIGWKSKDESHIIENFACNSTSWKSSAKSWVFKGLLELFVSEPETHFYREKSISRTIDCY